MEVEAVDEGTLGKILVADGTEGVKVNEPIALLLEEGESTSRLEAPAAAAPPRKRPASRRPSAQAQGASRRTAAPSPAEADGTEASGRATADVSGRPACSRARSRGAWRSRPASTSARIKGTRPARPDRQGRHRGGARRRPGREQRRRPAPAAAPAPAQRARRRRARRRFGAPHYDAIPLTTMRKVIARRLTEAKQTVPHFYLTIDCELDALLALRAQLNAGRKEGADYKLSVNDFVIKAVAIAHAQGARRQRLVGRRQDLPVQGHRRLGRGRDRRRPDHADHPQGRPEGPVRRSPTR